MAAEDAVPNRMGVAIEAARSLIQALGREPGARVAIVAFAGRGVLRCPLTANLGAAVDTLRSLRPGAVRPGGSDLAEGLIEALDAFDDQEHAEGRTIVVFSDGEDHAGRLDAILPRLKADRVIVHGVAIGDPVQGHPIPLPRQGPLTYHGEVVQTRRDDTPFELLAEATGGAVVRLGLAAVDLGRLYEERIAPVARQERQAQRAPERVERYALFVVAALVVGLAGSWPGRKRLPLVMLLALIAFPGAGQGGGTAVDLVAQGNALFAAGNRDDALERFERAIGLAPDAAIPRYDAAAVLYQLGRYEEAAARYREARAGRCGVADEDRLRPGQHGGRSRRLPGRPGALRRLPGLACVGDRL